MRCCCCLYRLQFASKIMSTQSSAFHCANALSSQPFLIPKKRPNYNFARSPTKSCHFSCVLKVGFDDVTEIIHNKVLIAAGFSAAIGQLSKPVASVVLYGKDFDFRTAFQAGGFPSTHSSSVVAAATALALERGLSDSIFGLTVVYAGLIMYDAQGVRREVGNHAKLLNKLKLLSDSQVTSTNDEGKGELARLRTCRVERSDALEHNISSAFLDSSANNLGPLKESIGHTQVEVVAGALLGFFVSFALYSLS